MRFFLSDYLGLAGIDSEDIEALFCALDVDNSADIGFAEFLWCARARVLQRALAFFASRWGGSHTRAARRRLRWRSIARSPRVGCDERLRGRLNRFMLSCEHFLPASAIATLHASGPAARAPRAAMDASPVRAAAAALSDQQSGSSQSTPRRPWEVVRIKPAPPSDHIVSVAPPSRPVAAEEAGGEEAGDVEDIKEVTADLAALEARACGERAALRATEARIAALEGVLQQRLATGGSGVAGEEAKRGEDAPSPMPSGARYRATKKVDALALAEPAPKRGATAARRCGTRDSRDPGKEGIHGGARASRVTRSRVARRRVVTTPVSSPSRFDGRRARTPGRSSIPRKEFTHSCSVVGGGAASRTRAGGADQENPGEQCDTITNICRNFSEANNPPGGRRTRMRSLGYICPDQAKLEHQRRMCAATKIQSVVRQFLTRCFVLTVELQPGSPLRSLLM